MVGERIDAALAMSRTEPSDLACCDCGRPMGGFSLPEGDGGICLPCNLAWLDGGAAKWVEAAALPKEVDFDHGSGPKEGYEDRIQWIGAKGPARVRDRSVSNWTSLLFNSPFGDDDRWLRLIWRGLGVLLALLLAGIVASMVQEVDRQSACESWCVDQGYEAGRTVPPKRGRRQMNPRDGKCTCVAPGAPNKPPSITYRELDAWRGR